MNRSPETNAVLLFVVVMHNGAIATSRAVNSLRGLGAEASRVVVMDNSTGDFGIQRDCLAIGFHYIDMGGNMGLSRAYNRALDFLFTQGYGKSADDVVIWLDDDTEVTGEYVDTLTRAVRKRPRSAVFLPYVSDEKTQQSPCRVTGPHVRRARNVRGIPQKNLTGINTGMAVRLNTYRNLRYNERLFLDYVDHSFMREIRGRRLPISRLEVRIRHGFYDNAHHPAEGVLMRLRIYLHDLRVYCEDQRFGGIYRLAKTVHRGLKLAARYRDRRFFTTMVRCALGRDQIPLIKKPSREQGALKTHGAVDISACIVTHNHVRTAVAAVESVIRNTKNAAVSMLVVDNASSDNTPEVVENQFPRIKVHRRQNNGFAAGQNAVLEHLNSKYHAIVNPDITFDEDVLSQMMEYMEAHPEVGLLSPKILHPDGSEQVLGKREPRVRYLIANRLLGRFGARLVREYAMLDSDLSGPTDIEFASGAFMMIRTDLFRALSGFDERFFLYFEDCDLSRRVREQGYRVRYLPEASVYHEWQRSDIANLRLFLIHVVSMLQYFFKWGWKW